MSAGQQDANTKPPEVLEIKVHETVKTGDGFGAPSMIFKNPKNDPNIAGLAAVDNVESLKGIAQMAFDYSKEMGKPVLLIVKAK
jgi:hypothetical protein